MKTSSVLFLALCALSGSRASILKGWGGAGQTVLKDGESRTDDQRAWKQESQISKSRDHSLDGVSSPSRAKVWSIKTGDEEDTQRKLTGKFLHITDVHPDPYYKTHSDTDEESACHRRKGPAGYYGAETSACDSPVSLLNATFDWIRENLRDEVDFVIWTGDSARHDNDEELPRSPKQVVQQNQLLVDAFLKAFGKKENFDDDDPLNDFVVPIVPTLGNNDILPHNIFTGGPNQWTTTYLTVWQQFIPEHEKHQFQRGGWFSVEVIPNKLVVFSLNTLYFFASNSAVDGCVGKNEPGYEQFEWLRVQLTAARSRGMKAILMGHVPPARNDAKTSWEESCWQKYSLWTHNFRDVLVGGLYGHMNIDHFMLQDFKEVKKHVRKGYEYDKDDLKDDVSKNKEDMVSIMSVQDYLVSLRDLFSKIPKVAPEIKHSQIPDSDPDYRKIGGQYGERYSLSLVSPSVVPNYFPTIRVFSYNISGMEDLEFPMPGRVASSFSGHVQSLESHDRLELRDLDDDDDINEEPGLDESRKKKKKKKPKKHKFTVPTPPTKETPPGPAYSQQPLSLISYTQYFANLTYINNDFVEDRTASITDFLRRWKPGKHHGKPPPAFPKPKPFGFEVEYDTASDKIYKLTDLTMNSVLDLARRIAGDATSKSEMMEDFDSDIEEDSDSDVEEDSKKKHKKHKKNKNKNKNKKPKKSKDKEWYAFLHRAFVGTIEPDDLKDQFLKL